MFCKHNYEYLGYLEEAYVIESVQTIFDKKLRRDSAYYAKNNIMKM